jgi:glycosyltransferase involved in cell wall biosynthesis
MTRHILVLDYLHVYNDRRMLQQTAALARMGYDVYVFGTARYGQHDECEIHNGVTFDHLPYTPTRQPLVLLRAFWRWLRGDRRLLIPRPDKNGLSSNLFAWLLYNLWAIRIGLRLKVDIIHCHEHTPFPAAWFLARWHRVPLVYDEHDNMELLRVYGVKGWIAEQFEKRVLLRQITAATTIGERLADSLRARGVPRVEVVGSWKSLDEFTFTEERLAEERERRGLNDYGLVVVFIATLISIRNIHELLDAVEASPDVALLIGGQGELEPAIKAAAQRAKNIIWLGWVNSQDVPLYTCLGDVVYNCIIPGPYDYYLAPNKLFDALAAGMPIIARSGVGEMADIIEQNDVGILLDEVTPETLQAAFRRLCDPAERARLSANALKARGKYNWAAAEKQLARLFEQLLEQSG